MPGMKRRWLTSLRLWQVEQARPEPRAGSPKISGEVEQHVAERDEEQVALVDALLLEVQHEARQRVLIVEIAAGRQPGP